MKKYNRNRSYLALAIAAVLTSNVTFAAEEVSVEAENLQQVLVSVTSIGAEDIAQNGITDVTDIQKYATNTTLQVSHGTSSTLTAYIRGIGMSDPAWGFEPDVGIYVDDVYVALPQGVMEIIDIEHVIISTCYPIVLRVQYVSS